ncbi:type VI secretion system-associated FHA domain protein TagH [Rhodobacter sp. NSM]|uniref:type VI secretion system-associated FHA domain protein TagH n=1 Tax=Rhodobacter sp. NSM TaxID=3457501 RepID=UPI003FD2262C
MMLRLVIEHSPCPQPVREMRFDGGELSIGRGADCDWQIDDPDMFVSRRHCIVSGRDGDWRVTDASRGGLFVDGAEIPLGAGNSAMLEAGTRLRLGDVVLRVEVEGMPGPRQAASSPRAPASFEADDFFSRPVEAPPVTPARPADLPRPFEKRELSPRAEPKAPFDEAFALDWHRPDERAPGGTTDRRNGFFDQPTNEMRGEGPPAAADWPVGPPAPARSAAADRQAEADAEAVPFHSLYAPAARHEPDQPPSDTDPSPAAAYPRPSDAVLRDAFFRGLGLPAPADISEAEMEALGRRFRALAEGLVLGLRTRARERGTAHVPQSVIGATDVNPLKFLATLDEAVASLVAPRGRGYLGPDDAILGAQRDLADHQMRNWAAMQNALRRMIDRFDPARFEAEIEREGLMSQILAGGRSARLWQLYIDRYRDMARAAEDRFLGEVGADFREAYEGPRRRDDG